MKGCEVVKDALDITFEVSKLICFSPKRAAQFQKLKAELAPTGAGFRVLCPTRWTVRAASLKSMIDNYTVLQELWEVSKNDSADPSMKARIIGVQTQFNSFKFYFGVELTYFLLQHSDNLSKTLQSPNAAEGQKLASMTIATLLQCRSDVAYDLFWKRIEESGRSLDIDEPALPRIRKLPRRLMKVVMEQHFRIRKTNSLDLIAVANDLISFSEHLIQIFGKFSEEDVISGGYCQKCKLTLECSKCCQ